MNERQTAVDRMVRLFYERGLADPVLGPIFRQAIHDWEGHIATVREFWLGLIYGEGHYQGNAFAPHAKLRFEPEAFEHWLVTFESAANDALRSDDAAKAIRIARHMAQSFKMGLFPFTTADGRPSRLPEGKRKAP